MNDRNALIEEALGRLKLDQFDEGAWADLYDSIVPRARAIAFRVLAGDATSSQDAVHDALVRLMRYASFDRFASADEFLKYFSMMVHRAALDVRRRQDADPGVSTKTLVSDSASGELDTDVDDKGLEGGSDPEAALSFKRAVENLSNSLSDREMLVCTLLASGYGRRELAARLGTSEPTAAVIIHRLRAKLRDLGHQVRGFS